MTTPVTESRFQGFICFDAGVWRGAYAPGVTCLRGGFLGLRVSGEGGEGAAIRAVRGGLHAGGCAGSPGSRLESGEKATWPVVLGPLAPRPGRPRFRDTGNLT